jgi:glycosyltransferase involved in cell wall biosynthesis
MSQSRISEEVLLGKASDPFATEPFPRRLAILNDYVRVPYANGSSFASQLLYREFSARGHDVSVVGPRDPLATSAELPRRHVELPSLPLRIHPGVHMPFPSREALATVAAQNFDIVLGQTGSALLELGIWLRRTRGVPMLCVNTIHLASVYDVILPDVLHASERFKGFCESTVVPFMEAASARMYNASDGLIVLSEGLKSYWQERGVRVPIHVIPRCIDPSVFDGVDRPDPFPQTAPRGHRLLCICRHTREKSVSRLLRIFAELVAPAVPDATLTLVGDGPDHDVFRAEALELGIADRTFFPGEQALADISGWYQHADVFVYSSLSETYGQVVSEALWSGLPVVAFEDGMGVSQQIDAGRNGILVPPGPDERAANWRFASEVAALLRDPARRHMFGQTARRLARERSSVPVAVGRYYQAFESAREHCLRTRHGKRDRALLPIWRWTALHSLTCALGTLRAPAVLNRNGQRQPGWDHIELVDSWEREHSLGAE